MSPTELAPGLRPALRDHILEHPQAVLNDPEVMAALVAADDGLRGGNVIDLRGLAISRLEDRLNRLESTHQSVLSAAYENVATTSQVHRAILAMIGPLDLDPFLTCLATDVADILRVSSVRILLESDAPLAHPVLVAVAPGEVRRYIDTWSSGRRVDIALRRIDRTGPGYHDLTGGPIRSEALIRLDLGDRYPAGVLALGSTSADHYLPSHATDLLELFGRVCERVLRGLLP